MKSTGLKSGIIGGIYDESLEKAVVLTRPLGLCIGIKGDLASIPGLLVLRRLIKLLQELQTPP